MDLNNKVHLGDAYAIHANLSEVYAEMNQFQKALFHNNRYWELKDSLLSLEKSNQVEGLLAKYESEKKEKEIALLRKEAELNDLEKQQQDQLQNGIIIGAFLLLVILLIIVFTYRQKNNHREQLLLKNEEINKRKILELIREHQLNAIKANIAGQEEEKNRVSSELHDGISGNLAGIKMMLSKIESTKTDDGSISAVIKKVDNTYEEVRSITHQLTPPGISTASFGQLIRNFLNEIANKDLTIDFITHPEEDLDYLSDETKIEIYRIIQELINNALKHAKSQKIIVQLVVSEDAVNLMVEDDGVGFDTKQMSEGLGLSNIRSRVTKVNDEIDIDSVDGRGTVVNIDIPVSQLS